MKNPKFLISFLLFLAFQLLWIFYIRDQLAGQFFDISEWGGYFLPIPLVYSFFALVDRSGRGSDRTIIFAIMCGSIAQVFLSRNLETGFWIQKIAMIFLSTILTMLVLARKPKPNL